MQSYCLENKVIGWVLKQKILYKYTILSSGESENSPR